MVPTSADGSVVAAAAPENDGLAYPLAMFVSFKVTLQLI